MKYQHVGQPVNRLDGEKKVLGQALFPGDYYFKNQVYVKTLYSAYPHAIIRSIDASRALAVKGVLGVLDASHVPNNKRGFYNADQPFLCGPGSTIEDADRVRFIGDQVALVVAESEEIAAAARDQIIVNYDPLPVVTDMEKALSADAPVIHPSMGSNVITGYQIRKGDFDAAMQKAEIIIEGIYKTPPQDHAYLQPEAAAAFYDENGILTVIGSGQHIHGDHEQICKLLGLPAEKVNVRYAAIGGGFGGRHEPQVRLNVAFAAWYLHQKGINRPVKMVYTREENIVTRHKRHPYIIKTRWGATREGKIIAVEADVLADGGAYTYSSPMILGNTFWMCVGPYEVENIRVNSRVVFTNNLVRCAFRGFGAPQAAFVAESQINKIAKALGKDPVEIRMLNAWREDSLMAVGTKPPAGYTVDGVIEACAREAGWEMMTDGWAYKGGIKKNVPRNHHIKRGIGFACGFKNVGDGGGVVLETSRSKIELRGDGEIEEAIVYQGDAEIGQGAHTALAQIAAELLHIPFEKVRMVVGDSALTLDTGITAASRTIFMSGNAVMGAAIAALKKWENEERPAIAIYEYQAPPTTPFDPVTGHSEVNFSFGYAAEAVEVEVDTETGMIHVMNVVCADDVGKAINPQFIEGQIEGAVVQGLGYVLLENFIQEGGYVLTPNFSTYLIPNVMDVPEKIKSVIIETPDPLGPMGARGMGEVPIVPVAAAVIAAVHDATGVWFNEFPLTPERVLRGLKEIEKK